MTKDRAFERICEANPLARNYEKFFRDTIDRFTGDSNIVTDDCFDKIREYLKNFT